MKIVENIAFNAGWIAGRIKRVVSPRKPSPIKPVALIEDKRIEPGFYPTSSFVNREQA